VNVSASTDAGASGSTDASPLTSEIRSARPADDTRCLPVASICGVRSIPTTRADGSRRASATETAAVPAATSATTAPGGMWLTMTERHRPL
jgi:hypothetical protein